MLVVIAIIAVLASLVASGVFQYYTVQKTSNTENTITKLMKSIKQLRDGVLRDANQNKVPQGVINMATGTNEDPKISNQRARVIWKKVQLKRYLPTSFQEALTPSGPANPYVGAADLPSLYARQLNGIGGGGSSESSVCLAMALQKSPSGVSLTLDNFSSAELQDFNPTNGLRLFVDAWGNSLVFERWPSIGDSYFSELDASNPRGASQRNRDPEDPTGLLLSPSWNNAANYNNQQGVYWFEQLCHPVHVIDPTTGNWVPKAWYFVPVVSSAGKNGSWGDSDDILSFRLRIGARGD
jgi:type II secretory pathway pseudopilin PulG